MAPVVGRRHVYKKGEGLAAALAARCARLGVQVSTGLPARREVGD